MTKCAVWSGLVYVVALGSVREGWAQTPTQHPTVAPFAPGVILNSTNEIAATSGHARVPPHPSTGPLMNPGNGIWDNGEAASYDYLGIDHGGFIDWPDTQPVLDDFVPGSPVPATVFQYSPNGIREGWQLQTLATGQTFWRLRAHLKEKRAGSTTKVMDAAFEVIAPVTLDRNLPTVVVITTPQTVPFAPADDLVSAIAWIEYTGASSFANATLRLRRLVILDGPNGPTGPNGLPKVYGVCGMAVGDIVPANSTQEIAIGSLDGHLLVLERLASGDFGALLHQEIVDGAVGAYHGIVIADLDNSGQNELYVAGSLGLRRWVP